MADSSRLAELTPRNLVAVNFCHRDSGGVVPECGPFAELRPVAAEPSAAQRPPPGRNRHEFPVVLPEMTKAKALARLVAVVIAVIKLV